MNTAPVAEEYTTGDEVAPRAVRQKVTRTIRSIPQSATPREIKGRATEGAHQGHRVRARLWSAHISLGRRSDYEAVPALWITIHVDGYPLYARRYTGKRLKVAEAELEEIASYIDTEGSDEHP